MNIKEQLESNFIKILYCHRKHNEIKLKLAVLERDIIYQKELAKQKGEDR